jgi:flagellar basal body-associated protein FliL
LRVVHENSIEESRTLTAELRSFRRSMLTIAIVVVVLLAACAGMILFLVVRP